MFKIEMSSTCSFLVNGLNLLTLTYLSYLTSKYQSAYLILIDMNTFKWSKLNGGEFWDVVQKGVQQVELELRLLEALAIYRPSKLAGTPYLLLLPFLRMEFNSKDPILNTAHSPNFTRIRHFFISWHLLGLESKILRLTVVELRSYCRAVLRDFEASTTVILDHNNNFLWMLWPPQLRVHEIIGSCSEYIHKNQAKALVWRSLD